MCCRGKLDEKLQLGCFSSSTSLLGADVLWLETGPITVAVRVLHLQNLH